MGRQMHVGLISIGFSAALIAGGPVVLSAGVQPRSAPMVLAPTPIKHVVIIFQENHSFDNVLGPICVNVLHNRCHGAIVGRKHDGTPQPLSAATDFVPEVKHTDASQATAMNGGAMNGFDEIVGCQAPFYACYSAFQPPQPGNPGFIPNTALLAEQYVIADQTFELSPEPSWGSHLSLVASRLDGFTGENPTLGTQGTGPGWGCDSKRDTPWRATPTSPTSMVPSCVPTAQGVGPYRSSPVSWVPTILDRLQAAKLGFKLYASNSSNGGTPRAGYEWSICPTFADCLLTKQRNSLVDPSEILKDTATGGNGLPAFSIVLPNGLGTNGQTAPTSQHNSTLMSVGDNWIGQVVQAIQNDSSDYSSTAIFLTWDDCGCFYDDVSPPPGSGNGIRVPMVIISPYARAATTDSTPASFASMLAFTEHVFSLRPLSGIDSNAYDYFGSFNFSAPPNLAKAHLVQQSVSAAAENRVLAIPADPNDST